MRTQLIGGLALDVEAVRLTPDAPWEQIAAWCYGKIENYRDERGEWHSYIAVPQTRGEPLKAWEWWWIVRYPNGTVAVFEDHQMPEAALWPDLWAKLAAHDGDGCACQGDPEVGCRSRDEVESRARWALRVVVEHLGLKPEVGQR